MNKDRLSLHTVPKHEVLQTTCIAGRGVHGLHPVDTSRTYGIQYYALETVQGQDKGVKRNRRLASVDVRNIIRSTTVDSGEKAGGNRRDVTTFWLGIWSIW